MTANESNKIRMKSSNIEHIHQIRHMIQQKSNPNNEKRARAREENEINKCDRYMLSKLDVVKMWIHSVEEIYLEKHEENCNFHFVFIEYKWCSGWWWFKLNLNFCHYITQSPLIFFFFSILIFERIVSICGHGIRSACAPIANCNFIIALSLLLGRIFSN